MTLTTPILSAYSIIKLSIAIWLFSRTLPRREPSTPRAAAVLLAAAALSGASVGLGFSVFPTLTDDLSFLTAILTFVGVLAVAVLAQLCVFECSPWTAIFCCSMAYALENVSSAVERLAEPLLPFSTYPPPLLESSLRYWAIAALVYAVAYALLIRRIEKNGLLQISDPVMVVAAALVIVVNMVLDLVFKDISVPDFGLPERYTDTLGVIYVLLCAYLMYSVFEIIYTRRLQMNMAAIERLRATEARQYEMSRANIEAINLKCHDIKHQIRTLKKGGATVDARVLDDIEREVDVYDSVVKSGNDALDTILTEKSLVCQRHGITLSCIADGPALDFMQAADLYSLFGNALDNAIEAVEALSDPEKKSISLIVRRVGAGDMVSIHVENFFSGELHVSEDGLPLTSKSNHFNHGFGVRSMRLIAEGYGGSLTTSAQDDVFHLNVLIPPPA